MISSSPLGGTMRIWLVVFVVLHLQFSAIAEVGHMRFDDDEHVQSSRLPCETHFEDRFLNDFYCEMERKLGLSGSYTTRLFAFIPGYPMLRQDFHPYPNGDNGDINQGAEANTADLTDVVIEESFGSRVSPRTPRKLSNWVGAVLDQVELVKQNLDVRTLECFAARLEHEQEINNTLLVAEERLKGCNMRSLEMFWEIYQAKARLEAICVKDKNPKKMTPEVMADLEQTVKTEEPHRGGDGATRPPQASETQFQVSHVDNLQKRPDIGRLRGMVQCLSEVRQGLSPKRRELSDKQFECQSFRDQLVGVREALSKACEDPDVQLVGQITTAKQDLFAARAAGYMDGFDDVKAPRRARLQPESFYDLLVDEHMDERTMKFYSDYFYKVKIEQTEKTTHMYTRSTSSKGQAQICFLGMMCAHATVETTRSRTETEEFEKQTTVEFSVARVGITNMWYPWNILRDDDGSIFQMRGKKAGQMANGETKYPCMECSQKKVRNEAEVKAFRDCMRKCQFVTDQEDLTQEQKDTREQLRRQLWRPSAFLICRDLKVGVTVKGGKAVEMAKSVSAGGGVSGVTVGSFTAGAGGMRTTNSSEKDTKEQGLTVGMELSNPHLCGYIAEPIDKFPKADFVNPGERDEKELAKKREAMKRISQAGERQVREAQKRSVFDSVFRSGETKEEL